VSRIRVGFKPKASAARGQLVEPGLAVDPAGGRVFLVPATGAAAEIRLADLRVGYHTLRRGGLRRLAAAEKEFRGPWRYAQYLGGGLIAVSGYHPPNLIAYSAQGQLRFQLKIDRPLGIVAAIGVYAYVWQSDNRVDVVDLASGTLVHTTAPTSLTPIALVPD
jgi:DNA-binding beta-propeller fold protein YncE